MGLATRWSLLATLVFALALFASASNVDPAFATISGAHPAAVESTGPIKGDVDCGGSIDAEDALGILAATADVSSFPCTATGDVQCDGDIDVLDALSVLLFTVGRALPSGPNCEAIGEAIAMSEQLIADALDAGAIDYETSLIYRAYALYGDERLPAAYRSPIGDLHAGTALFKEVGAHEGTLSVGTMDELAPFMARPNDPNSIFNQSHAAAVPDVGEWWSRPVAAGRYRIWTKGSEESAEAMLDSYEPDVVAIVPELAKVVDEPLPDEPGPNLEINLDDAIDIYLIDGRGIDPRCASLGGSSCYLGITGQTRDAAPFFGNKSSAWVLMDRNNTGAERIHVLAHELGHASQDGYDRMEYTDEEWLIDATAEWGSFRVLKQLGLDEWPVHAWLHPFMKQVSEVSLTESKFLQRYRSWLYFYFLELEKGSGDVVRQIWEAASADDVQLEGAIDELFPFEEYFPKFASYNWNQPPDDWYILDDQITEIAELFKHQSEDVALQGSAESRKFDTPADVKYLTARYYQFKFTDSGVRSGLFHDEVADDADAHVTALIQKNGVWKEEDWSDRKDVYFCRDKATENYEELVMIISNTDWKHERPSLAPEKDSYLQASAVGCKGWTGSVTGETHLGDATFSVTLSGVVFVPDPSDTDPFDNVVSLIFKSSTAITWHASGHWPRADCTVTGEMFLDQPGSGGPHEATGYLLFIRDTGEYSLDISGHNGDDELLTVACEGQEPYQNVWPVVRSVVWDGAGTPLKIMEENGHKLAKGSYSNPDRFTGGVWTWDLQEVQ